MPVFKKYLLSALVLLLLTGPMTKVMSSQLCTTPASLSGMDTVSLPFTENWDQGTFAYNNWVHSGNWVINAGVGNPAPTADYDGLPFRSNYNDTLQSVTFDATEYNCAAIYLDYDFELLDRNQTGAEYLTVEIHVDSAWKPLSEYSNKGDKPWRSVHLELNHTAGKKFQIRFRAHGVHSQDILHWFVDNISLYAVCRPPINLTYTASHYAVNLSWQPPDCNYNGPSSQWIHWDDGINFGSIGISWPFDMAAHWTPDQLTYLTGSSVTKISFFPTSAGYATFRARVWQGPVNSPAVVCDQDIPSVTYDQWNIVTLNTPVLIDVTLDLFLGVNVSPSSGWPAGTDAGPAIDGYGDMVQLQGVWSTLLSLCPSCDYNWNIQAYVESLKSATQARIIPRPPMPQLQGPVFLTAHATGNGKKFDHAGTRDKTSNHSIIMGYNVWRTNSTGDTSTFHKINGPIVADTTFTDIIPNDSLGVFEYYVTDVMNDSATNSFLCESPGTNRLTVSVPAVGISNNLPCSLSIFPDPSADIINVSSDLTIHSIGIINYTGREVCSGNNVNSKTVRLNVSALPAGIYFVKITHYKGTGISKITVVH